MNNNEMQLIQEYVRVTNKFKIRRLVGLVIISIMLMIPLYIIYMNGWSDLSGGSTGWLAVGIFVSISAIAAVLIDLFWRK